MFLVSHESQTSSPSLLQLLLLHLHKNTITFESNLDTISTFHWHVLPSTLDCTSSSVLFTITALIQKQDQCHLNYKQPRGRHLRNHLPRLVGYRKIVYTHSYYSWTILQFSYFGISAFREASMSRPTYNIKKNDR